MTVNFEYYKIFYYAGKYRNFTRAAKVLQTSQSAVSHAMQTLEHQLGCRLFIRNNRGITLTPEGERLYAHVEPGCQQLFLGEEAVSASVALEGGTVSVATTETSLHCCLFAALDQFHRQYPQVRFKLMNHLTGGDAVAAVRNGTADYAVTPSPVPIQKPLALRELMTFRDVLLAGAQYAHLREAPRALAEIAGYPLMCLVRGTTTRTFLEGVFSAAGVTLSPDVEATTTDMILPLVTRNLGVGFVPEPLARAALARGEVYEVPMQEALPVRRICAVYDTGRPKSLAAKAFFDSLPAV